MSAPQRQVSSATALRSILQSLQRALDRASTALNETLSDHGRSLRPLASIEPLCEPAPATQFDGGPILMETAGHHHGLTQSQGDQPPSLDPPSKEKREPSPTNEMHSEIRHTNNSTHQEGGELSITPQTSSRASSASWLSYHPRTPSEDPWELLQLITTLRATSCSCQRLIEEEESRLLKEAAAQVGDEEVVRDDGLALSQRSEYTSHRHSGGSLSRSRSNSRSRSHNRGGRTPGLSRSPNRGRTRKRSRSQSRSYSGRHSSPSPPRHTPGGNCRDVLRSPLPRRCSTSPGPSWSPNRSMSNHGGREERHEPGGCNFEDGYTFEVEYTSMAIFESCAIAARRHECVGRAGYV